MRILRILFFGALLAATGVGRSADLPLQHPAFDRSCGPACCGPGCSDSCSNTPFEPTDCRTTDYGPARANIVIGGALTSTNMLLCAGGTESNPRPYALCFFSGPPVATGMDSGNKVLQCTPDRERGIAHCACQVYTTGPYYVDINSILNRGAFYETRRTCGMDGAKCRNIAVCDSEGKTRKCKDPPCPPCPETEAPVCTYVDNQSTDPEDGLYPPGPRAPEPRVDLVSAFSMAMGDVSANGPYQLGSTPCDSGLYAGCMTAPCRFGDAGTSDGSVVECACPMWRGEYEIGQNGLPSDLECPKGRNWVWSAAHSVTPDPAPGEAGQAPDPNSP